MENRLKIIKEFAIQSDWDNAFGGKTRGNRHLFRVAKIARFLAKKEKVNIFISEAGALLHDIILSLGYNDDYDYARNKKLCFKELKKLPLSKDELIKISECVASHEGTIKPTTLEAQIVHDADVLEKSGLLGLIRHTWKLTNSGIIDPEKISKLDVEKVIKHIKWREKQIDSEEAKKISKELNNSINFPTADIIVRQTSRLAAEGVITEKIARSLFSKLSNEKVKVLESQLNLSYLK